MYYFGFFIGTNVTVVVLSPDLATIAYLKGDLNNAKKY